MNDLVTYTKNHQMKLNTSKTKVILFNKATKYDFHPKLTLQGEQNHLEVVEEIHLLGVRVRSDLSWKSNTASMCRKAYARILMLRRLKPLGPLDEELLDVYGKQIRGIVEYALPIWPPGLTVLKTQHR